MGSSCSDGTPMPVSVTLKATTVSASFSVGVVNSMSDGGWCTESRTLPTSVNFRALDSRFLSTCCRRSSSVTIVSGSSGSSSTISSKPCCSASGPKFFPTYSHTPESTTGAGRTSIFPASTLDRSRMSLISDSRSEPALWMVRANSICLSDRFFCGLSASSVARISKLFSGVRSSWLMLVRNSDLYCDDNASCAALSSRPRRAISISRFLISRSLDCAVSSARLVLELGVGALRLDRLHLQLLGEPLRLREQLLGADVGDDRVEHDADGLDELLEEAGVHLVEAAEGCQLDDAEHLLLEQHRQHEQVGRRAGTQPGLDLQVVGRHVAHPDRLLLHRGLTDQALTRPEDATVLGRLRGVRRCEPQLHPSLRAVREVERALHGLDDRSDLAHDHLGDRVEVALTLQLPADAREVALQPVLLGVDLGGRSQVRDHLVDVVLELRDLALRLDVDRPGQVAAGHRGRDLGDRAHLGGQVAGELVDVLRQVPPRAAHAGDLGLTAELALGADLAGHAGDLGGERGQLVDHRVDGALQVEDLALRVDGDLLAQVSLRDGRGHESDVADLAGQVGRHQVHRVGEVAPGAGDALDLGLATEPAFGADLARDAGHLVGEGRELVDHRVDGVLQLQDLALGVDGDLLTEVTGGDRGGDLGDVADLAGEVRGHRVDVVGQVAPGARDALDLGLTAEPALGADLTGDTGHLVGERARAGRPSC